MLRISQLLFCRRHMKPFRHKDKPAGFALQVRSNLVPMEFTASRRPAQPAYGADIGEVLIHHILCPAPCSSRSSHFATLRQSFSGSSAAAAIAFVNSSCETLGLHTAVMHRPARPMSLRRSAHEYPSLNRCDANHGSPTTVSARTG